MTAGGTEGMTMLGAVKTLLFGGVLMEAEA
jgi:hypothetical protein